MNGIKFGPDMGISQTRWIYTSNNKNAYLNPDSVGEINSVKANSIVVKSSDQEKIQNKLKKEKSNIERRKYIRLSTYDYLNMEENILDEIKFNFDINHPMHEQKTLLSPLELIEKGLSEALNKYEFASVLAHLSEKIITNARKDRDGDDTKKEQLVLDTLIDKAEQTKRLLFNKYSYAQTPEKKENISLENTLKQIFITQRKYNNIYAIDTFENECFNYIQKRIALIKANSRPNKHSSKFTSNDFFNYKLKTSLL